MKRVNFMMDEQTEKYLNALQDLWCANRTTIIRQAVRYFWMKTRDEMTQSVSPSTVGQQVGPTVLGGQQQEEEE